MKKDLIRIFINNKDYVKISPFSSLYTLKQTIKETFYKNISYNSILLYYNDKPLLKDSYSLVQYNITDNTHIFTRIKTIGGNSDFFEKLMVVLFCIFIVLCYFGILALGLLPIMASIFGLIINKGVNFFINKFNIDVDKTKYIFKFIFWIFKTFIIIFFIWGLTAIVAFPLYSLIGYSKCESGIKSKRVGKVTMIWFIVFYFMFNIVDFILSFWESKGGNKTKDVKVTEGIFKNISGDISDLSLPIIKSIKNINDSAKFWIFYIIPFIGQLLEGYHIFLDIIVNILFTSLEFTSEYILEDKSGNISEEGIIRIYEEFQRILGDGNEQPSIIDVAIRQKLEQNGFIGITNQIYVALFDEIENKNIKPPNEKNKNIKPPNENIRNEYSKKKTSKFFKYILFEILKLIKNLNKLIHKFGTANDILNMLKTSQIVGILCIPVFPITFLIQ